MRTLIVLVVGLLAVGCETPMPEEKKALEQKPKSFRDSVVGEYELKSPSGNTHKYVFLDNGIYEIYINGKKDLESKWSIVKGEIHVGNDSGVIIVYRINKDKSITSIASIYDGERTGWSREGWTFKKTK